MRIARFWAKGQVDAVAPSGKRIKLACWRWSERSHEEAQRLAVEAAKRGARRVESGEPLPRGYGYLDRPPREEILEEIRGNSGGVIATVTRNAYGALVLNTQDLMFIDVDLPRETLAAKFLRALGKLLGKDSDDPESRMRKQLTDLARVHREYVIRIYRTYAGFRCAIVNKPISPLSQEGIQLLHEFGADPLYIKLCQIQECYRARLTPKFWRCGVRRPPSRFPWEQPEEERRFRSWEKDYHEKCKRFATCRFVEQFEEAWGNAELKSLIERHDRLTKAGESLKLA